MKLENVYSRAPFTRAAIPGDFTTPAAHLGLPQQQERVVHMVLPWCFASCAKFKSPTGVTGPALQPLSKRFLRDISHK